MTVEQHFRHFDVPYIELPASRKAVDISHIEADAGRNGALITSG